jgi:molybdopterin-binding protein
MIDEAECPEHKLKGKFLDVRKGAATTHVEIDIGGGVVTASITNESGRRT